jgi:hypothetical protein
MTVKVREGDPPKGCFLEVGTEEGGILFSLCASTPTALQNKLDRLYLDN